MKRIVLACLLATFLALPVPAQDGPHRFAREIPIPGDGSRDLLSVDSAAYRPFGSDRTRIVVFDTERDTIGGEITEVAGLHGLTPGSTVDPGTHRIHLAVPEFEARAPGPTGRPKAIPGRFRVLVYEMSPVS